MRSAGAIAFGLVFACGETLPPSSDERADGGTIDATGDASASDATAATADAAPWKPCSVTTPFRPAELIVGNAVNVTSTRFGATLNATRSILFFSFIDTNGLFRIAYAAPTPQNAAVYGTPIALVSEANAHDSYPWLSLDGQRLYFASTRAVGGSWDVYRVNVATDPGATVLAGAVSVFTQPGNQIAFTLTEDEREMLLTSDQGIFHYAADTNGNFASPDALAQPLISGPAQENHPAMSPDGLVVYFGSLRDQAGSTRVYRATRNNKTEAFGNVTKETSLEGFASGEPSHLTRDLCRLYFFARKSDTAPDFTLYVAERDPPP